MDIRKLQKPLSGLMAGFMLWSTIGTGVAAAATDVTLLANEPIFAGVNARANVLLDLSVEFPTAISVAHLDTSFSTTKIYKGYFDPNKCYKYVTSGGLSYFEPMAATVSATDTRCLSDTTGGWSGNFMNWATMQAIDLFRWALTGGYRVKDEPKTFGGGTAVTILRRAYASNQGSDDNFPNRSFNVTTVADYIDNTSMGFAGGTTVTLRNRTKGFDFWVGTNVGGACPSGGVCKTYTVQVQVCKTGMLEKNCSTYQNPANDADKIYKPTGLLQENANKMNFGAFGYLMDSNILRDGGVLRAQIQSLASEIAETGAFKDDPYTLKNTALGINYSGTINYLNMFGNTALSYKTYDNISELYAESIKYLMGKKATTTGGVTTYTPLTATSTYISGLNNTMRDGFPVFGADGTTWNDPVQYSCQKNFIVGIGDVNTHADKNLKGNPSRSSNEPSSIPSDVLNVDAHAWTNKVGTLEGISNLGSTENYGGCCNNNGAYIAGLAYYGHTQNLRPDLTSDATSPVTVSTYWVDVLEYSTYKTTNQYWLATKYGGFEDKNKNGVYDSGDLWSTKGRKYPASTGQALPDNYFPAADADGMVAGLAATFSDIASKLSTGTGVGVSASALAASAGTTAFQIAYDTGKWSGDLKALQASVTDVAKGEVTITEKWSAADKIKSIDISTRKIVTLAPNAAGTKVGVPFNATGTGGVDDGYAKFDTSQKNALGASDTERKAVMKFLRGDRTAEATASSPGLPYRERDSRLGDIANSKPLYVGPPDAIYSDLFNPGYSAFKTARADRTPVVYLGANDGMLHAYDATVDKTDSGKELFALVPYALFTGPDSTPDVSGLKALSSKTYTHHYYVDGTPYSRDIDFARAGKTTWASVESKTSDWRTILVTGLGKGGRSYVAMDVTNPKDWGSEQNVAGKVLWEFTNDNLGYTFGRPMITKTRKYGWVVIFPAGYNNINGPAPSGGAADNRGKGALFIVNPTNGTLLETIYTSEGSLTNPAGLAHIEGYTQSGKDGTVEQVYGGDLLGNVWRFDLSSSGTAKLPDPVRIAILKDPTDPGKVQPITTEPRVDTTPVTGARYVFVGTGKLLHSSDVPDKQTQTFYAIRDGSRMYPYTDASDAVLPLPGSRKFPIDPRKDMIKVTLDGTENSLVAGIKADASKPLGWFIDMSGHSTNERVVVHPQINSGLVTWMGTSTTNDDPCAPDAKAYVYTTYYGSAKTALYELVADKPALTSSIEVSKGAAGVQQIRIGRFVRLWSTSSDGGAKTTGVVKTGKDCGTIICAQGELAPEALTPRLKNWRIIETQ